MHLWFGSIIGGDDHRKDCAVKTTYDPALDRLLAHEGNYTNHPSDPGGPTNFGITIYDAQKYAAEFGWIVGRKVGAADVKAMPLSFAKLVYRAKYWDSQKLDFIEAGPDYALFDYGVNSGVGRSGRVLRRILKMSDETSIINDEVVYAANKMAAAELVRAICDERLRFLQNLKTWPVFGKGWGRRVAEVRAYGISIANDLPLGDPTSIVPAVGRGIDPDKFAKVRALQASLVGPPGLYDGAIDGDLGPKTIKAFQRSRGLVPVDGRAGIITRPLLDKALAEIAPARASVD